jgi:glycosyltransferase involved in cell wall biosynthesis
MEAWASGLPVVSLEAETSELLCERDLGVHTRSMGEAVEAARRLLGHAEMREAIGARAEAYVYQFLAPEVVAAHYERFLLDLTPVRTAGAGKATGR